MGSGDPVGWAIANTNGEGELIVETHLDDGIPYQTFDVWVKLNYPDWWGVVAQLTTNRQGKGNAHATIDISSVTDTAVDVQVVVKPTGETAIIGYATATEPVPLKK